MPSTYGGHIAHDAPVDIASDIAAQLLAQAARVAADVGVAFEPTLALNVTETFFDPRTQTQSQRLVSYWHSPALPTDQSTS